MKTLMRIALTVLLLPHAGWGQVQTVDQCLTTAQARSGVSLSKSQIRDLCENNSDEVVDCALSQTQVRYFSGDLKQSIKDCRRQFIYTLEPTPAPTSK